MKQLYREVNLDRDRQTKQNVRRMTYVMFINWFLWDLLQKNDLILEHECDCLSKLDFDYHMINNAVLKKIDCV